MIPRAFQRTLDVCDAWVLLAVIRGHGHETDDEILLTKWGIDAYLGWPRDRVDRAAGVLASRGLLRFVR